MAQPKAEPEAVWEAMVPELNPRGMPFVLGSKEFPPGEWVEVTAEGADRLRQLGWAQVRQREG